MVVPTPSASANLVAALLAAAGACDYPECDRLFAAAARDLEPLELIRDVVSPALREAGNRWHRGEWAVVQERILSGVARRQLSAALDRYLTGASGPRILFTTLEGERHELGGLMGAVVAASRGFRSLYLGPDLPVADIGLVCSRQPVEVLALSLVTQPDVNDARGQLAELRRIVPAGTVIWIAGQAAQLLARETLPPGIIAIPDMNTYLDCLAGLPTRTT